MRQVDAVRQIAAHAPRIEPEQRPQVVLRRRLRVDVRHRLVAQAGVPLRTQRSARHTQRLHHRLAAQGALVQQAAIRETRVRDHHARVRRVLRGGQHAEPARAVFDDQRAVDEALAVVREIAPRVQEGGAVGPGAEVVPAAGLVSAEGSGLHQA
jgi:hypothetical protein